MNFQKLAHCRKKGRTMALKQPQKEEYTVHDVQDALDSLLARG